MKLLVGTLASYTAIPGVCFLAPKRNKCFPWLLYSPNARSSQTKARSQKLLPANKQSLKLEHNNAGPCVWLLTHFSMKRSLGGIIMAPVTGFLPTVWATGLNFQFGGVAQQMGVHSVSLPLK